MSSDGRYVAFASNASNLVPNDSNGSSDVFVHDRSTGDLELISAGPNGNPPSQGTSTMSSTSMSADGRYVAFSSNAPNLVPGVSNGAFQIYVRDRATWTTTLISVDRYGQPGSGNSFYPSISADGRYVAFASMSPNLVLNDPNWVMGYDVFVREWQTGTTWIVSVDNTGLPANSSSHTCSISPDGRYVAFKSFASNLVPNDANGQPDVFLHDRDTGHTELVNVDNNGAQANYGTWPTNPPIVGADGRYVVFESDATNLVPGGSNGFFLRDRTAGTTTHIAVPPPGKQFGYGNYPPKNPFISTNGRYVTFLAVLVPAVPGASEPYDVFLRDLATGTTEQITSGLDASGYWWGGSSSPVVTPDAHYVSFTSYVPNLVPNDNNAASDVFVKIR